MGKTVLVTGACGFIGRNVARFFSAQGNYVIGIGHGTWSPPEWSAYGLLEWHASDLTLDALRTFGGKPDIIAHCAGSGSVGYSVSHPYQDFERTVGTTLNVLEFVRECSPRARVVYPSSAAVYGIHDRSPIPVDCAPSPISPYGENKRVAELMIQAYSRYFSVNAAIVRVFSAFGPGLKKQLLFDACARIEQGRFEFSGTGEETRDWLYVDDIASLILTASENASPRCPIVNGGTGVATPVKEVLREIFACMNVSAQAAFSGQGRTGDPVHYLADISGSLQWGWKPSVTWQQGVRQYVKWFKAGAH